MSITLKQKIIIILIIILIIQVLITLYLLYDWWKSKNNINNKKEKFLDVGMTTPQKYVSNVLSILIRHNNNSVGLFGIFVYGQDGSQIDITNTNIGIASQSTTFRDSTYAASQALNIIKYIKPNALTSVNKNRSLTDAVNSLNQFGSSITSGTAFNNLSIPSNTYLQDWGSYHGTYMSATDDVPNSYWQYTFSSPQNISGIEIFTRIDTQAYSNTNNLIVELYDIINPATYITNSPIKPIANSTFGKVVTSPIMYLDNTHKVFTIDSYPNISSTSNIITQMNIGIYSYLRPTIITNSIIIKELCTNDIIRNCNTLKVDSSWNNYLTSINSDTTIDITNLYIKNDTNVYNNINLGVGLYYYNVNDNNIQYNIFASSANIDSMFNSNSLPIQARNKLYTFYFEKVDVNKYKIYNGNRDTGYLSLNNNGDLVRNTYENAIVFTIDDPYNNIPQMPLNSVDIRYRTDDNKLKSLKYNTEWESYLNINTYSGTNYDINILYIVNNSRIMYNNDKFIGMLFYRPDGTISVPFIQKSQNTYDLRGNGTDVYNNDQSAFLFIEDVNNINMYGIQCTAWGKQNLGPINGNLIRGDYSDSGIDKSIYNKTPFKITTPFQSKTISQPDYVSGVKRIEINTSSILTLCGIFIYGADGTQLDITNTVTGNASIANGDAIIANGALQIITYKPTTLKLPNKFRCLTDAIDSRNSYTNINNINNFTRFNNLSMPTDYLNPTKNSNAINYNTNIPTTVRPTWTYTFKNISNISAIEIFTRTDSSYNTSDNLTVKFVDSTSNTIAKGNFGIVNTSPMNLDNTHKVFTIGSYPNISTSSIIINKMIPETDPSFYNSNFHTIRTTTTQPNTTQPTTTQHTTTQPTTIQPTTTQPTTTQPTTTQPTTTQPTTTQYIVPTYNQNVPLVTSISTIKINSLIKPDIDNLYQTSLNIKKKW